MYMLQNMSPRVPDRVDVVVPYSTKVHVRISIMILANLRRRLAVSTLQFTCRRKGLASLLFLPCSGAI